MPKIFGSEKTLVSCPYCDVHFIEEDDLVCEDCTDKITLDALVFDLNRIIKEIEGFKVEVSHARISQLQYARNELQKLVGNIQTKWYENHGKQVK